MMEGKIISFDPLNKGDQFNAEMKLLGSPWTTMLKLIVPAQCFFLAQNHGENFVALISPAMMRGIAEMLSDAAAKWERGEIPGMKVPEKKTEDQGPGSKERA